MLIIYFIIGFMFVTSLSIFILLVIKEINKNKKNTNVQNEKTVFYPEQIKDNNIKKYMYYGIETNRKMRGSVRCYNNLIEDDEDLSNLSNEVNEELKLRLGEQYYEYIRQKV